MSLWANAIGKIAGMGGKIADNVTKAKLAKTGDKVQQENNTHNEQMAVLSQYANEFRTGAGKLNEVVDFINRLPRPMFAITAWIAFAVRYFTPMLVYIRDGLSLETLMQMYSVLWEQDVWIIGGIIAFYFGGRLMEKRQDYAVKKSASDKIGDIIKESKPADKSLKVVYSPDCTGRLSKKATMDMVISVAKEVGADKVVITGADRTPEVQKHLEEIGSTTSKYETTQHGEVKGYKAADVKMYKEGEQIKPVKVAVIAEDVPIVGGVGVYDTFTHIDRRDRKPDGSVAKWGKWA